MISHVAHITHLAPAMVVTIRCVVVPVVVGTLDVQFWIVRMVSEVLQLSKQSCGMLAMDLICESPERALPDHTCLSVLDSQVVFIIDALRAYCKVEVCNIKPEKYCCTASNNSPHLEPTLRVHIV